ncbi:UDP-N-acetylglucosamine 2-epimerase (non-hydrolysing) [Breznakibacter xylanolyticus]|uniref:UDP-N-acetylglucosamine 2-epimerase (non-hydrolyzing) n=1 Tax=Breznakibacter xylanolyticus TaxID=990 RepID=A0A2W7NFQ6_9BACT|nr:UDP-N-acetylglucosamine 2-epimerase (non-hydrolyzing) [Breznakibacter xylanolyticus]PZX11936.1 UDP-N-acetylglucosamine 2-epimerase (non-hydrolysing) [Breznakibacter xylanolyticus]
MKRKVLIVFGTRPEAIKMAPLIKVMEKNKDLIDFKVCITAQHREMLDQVLKIFDLTADFDLDLMKPGQDLTDITIGILKGIKPIIEEYQPNLVLVHGDTSTSTATALAAFYKQIPVGHIEAGLRTNDIYSPWPEEMNRQITGRISTFHFAPTEWAANNLKRENVNINNIFITGNTVIDALHFAIDRIKNNIIIETDIIKLLKQEIPNFEKIKDKKIILVTGHRRENFGSGFLNICEALKEIASQHDDVEIIYPVHLNPNVQQPVNKLLGNIQNIHLTAPLEYLHFIYLMHISYFVLTDSGGIQEEAPGFGKPVLVMRNTTERPEGISAGTVKLVGTDKTNIIKESTSLIEDQHYYELMAKATNPYGNGKASELIFQHIINNI